MLKHSKVRVFFSDKLSHENNYQVLHDLQVVSYLGLGNIQEEVCARQHPFPSLRTLQHLSQSSEVVGRLLSQSVLSLWSEMT